MSTAVSPDLFDQKRNNNQRVDDLNGPEKETESWTVEGEKEGVKKAETNLELSVVNASV